MSTQIDTTTILNSTRYSNQRNLVKTSSGTLVLFARKAIAGTRIDLVYKTSSDNGTTWSDWIIAFDAVDYNTEVYNVDAKIDTNDDILLVYDRQNGYPYFVKLTNNGDDTWTVGTHIRIVAQLWNRPVICRGSDNNLYVALFYSANKRCIVYKSTNEGATWSQILTNAAYLTYTGHYIIPQSSNIWIFARDNSTSLYVYQYDGASWSQTTIANDLPNASAAEVCAVKVSDNEIYVAVPHASGIKVYTYNGVGWDAGVLISTSGNDAQPTISYVGGTLLVAYRTPNGASYDIAYNMYFSGAWQGSAKLTTDGLNNTQPSFIDTDSTTGHIAWTSGTASPYSIMFSSPETLKVQNVEPSLQWEVVNLYQLDPVKKLEWVTTVDSKKFCPNLINFDFKWDIPVISSCTVPILAYGCLYGYSVYIGDTGDSGSTVVELYLNNTLQKTITIPADSSAFSERYYFDLSDELNVSDSIKVNITNVADNSQQLKLNVYQMSFPFHLDKLLIANLYDGYTVKGSGENILFNTADNWFIEMNQPIRDIQFIYSTLPDTTREDLTATITDGLFKDSRILIDPLSDETITNISLTVVDMKDVVHTFNYDIINRSAMTQLPTYNSLSELTAPIYSDATRFCYSFDGGVTFSAWETTEDGIVIDFSGQLDNTYNLIIKYYIGTLEIQETHAITYLTSVIDASITYLVNGARLTYEDAIPFSSLDIYIEDALYDTLTPTLHTGFATISKDATNKTIQISSGSVYFNNEKYDYTSTIQNIDSIIGTTLIQRLFFVFDTLDKTFKWILNEEDNVSYKESTNSNYYTLYSAYLHYLLNANTLAYTITFGGDDLFAENETIVLDMLNNTDITFIIKDIAGRELEIEKEYTQTVYDTYWRTLTVTNSTGDVVKEGEISLETTLTYTITIEEI